MTILRPDAPPLDVDDLDAPPPAPPRRPGGRHRSGPPPSRPLPAGQVVVVGVVAFVLAALFNAETLDEMAERQPFGWRRNVALAVTNPLHAVSRAFLLDRPGEWFDEARGRNQRPIDLAELADPPPPASAHDAPDPGGQPSAGGAPAPTAAPTTTTLPVLRQPTAADPLRLWVGGDSMAQVFGESLVRLASETGVMAPTLDYRISTGLSRPDYFDWPARLVETVRGNPPPEVMVIIFGANDAQRLQVEGQVVDVDSPVWQAEYRRRVAAVMDFLARDGRTIFWVGQPVMRSGDFSRRLDVLNAIFAEEAARRPAITFVDTRPLFANASGGFESYLPDAGGRPTLVRQADGIHLSRAGGDRLASHILDLVRQELARSAG